MPDIALGRITADIVPQMKPGAIVLTLDPAAAYAEPADRRDDVVCAVAHPCHPSIFLQRNPRGVGRHVRRHRRPAGRVAAVESDDPAKRGDSSRPSCGRLRPRHRRALGDGQAARPARADPGRDRRLHDRGAAQRGAGGGHPHDGRSRSRGPRILLGHTQVALANSLRGDNPFSDACLIAMDYGRESIIKDDWKKIFDDELDKNLARMLHLDAIDRSLV